MRDNEVDKADTNSVPWRWAGREVLWSGLGVIGVIGVIKVIGVIQEGREVCLGDGHVEVQPEEQDAACQ